MFLSKSNLESIDLSNLDTSNVTNMYNMFACCYNLKEVNVDGFITSKVTNMQGMYYQCYALEYLYIMSFDFTSVTNVHGMFRDSSKLSGQMLVSSNPTNVYIVWALAGTATDSSEFTIFYTDEGKTFATSLYDTRSSNSNIKLREYGKCEVSFENDGFVNVDSFYVDTNTTVDLPTPEYEDLEFLYWQDEEGNQYRGNALVTKDIHLKAVWKVLKYKATLKSDFEFKNYLSSNITSVVTLNTAITDEYKESAKVISADDAFCKIYYYEVGSTAYLQPEVGNTRIVLNSELNKEFSSLNVESVDLSNLSTPNLTTMEDMSYGCTRLKYVDLSSFDTPKLIRTRQMFRDCTSLEAVNLGVHNSSAMYDTSYMFYNCPMLTDLKIDNLYLNSAVSTQNMFVNCSRLSGYWIIHTSKIPAWTMGTFLSASTETEDPFILYYDEGCENLANNLYSSRSSNSSIEVKPITEMN